MGKDAQHPFCLAQLHHMVSSVNLANCLRARSKSQCCFCVPAHKQLSKKWVAALHTLTRCCPVLLLCQAWCIECPSGLHKSSQFPFSCLTPISFGTSRFSIVFGDQTRHLKCSLADRLKVLWALYSALLLFEFFLLSLLFLQTSEPLKWFKFFLAIWGLGFWPRRNFAALSWYWQNLHRNALCSPFLLWKRTYFLCV